MEISIKGDVKEIAALVAAMQGRQAEQEISRKVVNLLQKKSDRNESVFQP